MRKTAFLVFAIIVGVLFTSSVFAADEQKPITLNAQHTLDPTHPYHLGLLDFKERVERLSEGKIKVNVVGQGQLGSERDAVEGLQIGSTQITAVSTAIQAGFVPEMQIFDMWFLFSNANHLFRTMDGPIGDKIEAKLLDKGIRVLGWWYGGVRDIYTSKKTVIKSIKDIQGKKIRTFENPIYLSALNATGALATPVAWGEVYTALQQGVVDGAEGASLTYRTVKHYEVAPNLTLTHHTLGGSTLLISNAVYKNLSKWAQDIIDKAAIEATEFQRKKFLDLEAENLTILRSMGVQVIEIDNEPFAAAVRPTYVKFENTVGKANIEQILSTR